MALDVSVEALGGQWQVTTVDLSPHGVKVALPANSIMLPPGTCAELRLALPDGDSPLVFPATVVRTDPDGIALNFAKVEDQHFQRLKDLVNSLLQSLSDEAARFGVSVRPVKDRRKAPRVDVELDTNLDAEQPHFWQGKTINLSPSGVKVALPATAIQPPWGTSVQLRLAAIDGRPPISVKGIVWRREPEGTALLLVEVGREQLEHLKALVESLRA